MKTLILIALALLTSSLNAAENWDVYVEKTLASQDQIPPCCSKEKAQKMMQLIYDTHPNTCVEIGVFGASSIYPTAKALRYLKDGIVYPIDPWSNREQLQDYTSEDPLVIEKNFSQTLITHHIYRHCNILRASPEDALIYFIDGSIDILHIDGNRTEEVVFNDVQMYLPKLKIGGYLWFDDANWSSTNKVVDFLLTSEQLVHDVSRSTQTCYLFKKIQ